MAELTHLPNVEAHCYCPQVSLTLDLRCRRNIFELDQTILVCTRAEGTIQGNKNALICVHMPALR